ncbi:MAG: dienelactone hydrolase family protein [Planctomycetales bacterium]
MPVRLFAVALVCFGSSFCGELIAAEPLQGTKPLSIEQPLDVVMVDGIDRFCLKELAASVEKRAQRWKRDYSSREAYDKSVAPNRERLRTILGVVDPRVKGQGLELIATTAQPALVGRGEGFTVQAVRWAVLDGVTAEGLLLEPTGAPRARVVALPDADWAPEQIVGLAEGVAPASQLARRLAENGCQVLVPTLISRDDTFSGHPDVRYTNQPHREFIYRQAFEMGRHIIGYEVQKILAAVDLFAAQNAASDKSAPIGVAGVGEGGLLALYSAALDTRIDGALVSGYFGPREGLWQEPIYRNVWALLTEFGDSDLASLVAPRRLIIEAAAAPEVSGPAAPKQGRSGGAAPGRIVTGKVADIQPEYQRALTHFDKLKSDGLKFVMSGDGSGQPISDRALAALLAGPGGSRAPKPAAALATNLRADFDPQIRQKRQFDELVEFTQKLLRRSARVRDQIWSKADRSSLDKWNQTVEAYRDMVYDEMIGRLPAPTIDPAVRTRQVLDEPGYVGYEVMIDVYPDVIAGGILLLPKDLKPGEKRPVVVCQHGLEGVPMDTISKTVDGFKYYSAFTSELANRGFITYAPQNPYRGQDRFRTLQRKSNPLQRSLFSYIIPQHQRTIDFLKTLPNVDPERIAFYGLSYGGKTAVRVPPMLKDYCLSICSADFNEWVVKNTTVYDGYSYVFTGEYEIFEWNMGHTANYAELSNLMTPRPFMVERGHHDGVAPDEWVAWEFAKVYRHYDVLGLGDKAEIEFFNGPHKINGVKTYDFLHRHLRWPKREAPKQAAK